VQAAVDELKSAVSSNDPAAMNRAMEQLTQAQHKAAEALYKQAGSSPDEPAPGGPEGSAAPGGGSAPGDVIDAEVVEDEKK
jgi:molecular chaperone DnaK